jgi:hypothetical protein
MFKFNRQQMMGSTTIVLCSLALLAPHANAGVLHNGWNYSIDAQYDGAGGEPYDIGGFAFRETENDLYFALTGNMGIEGYDESHPAVEDGNIGWGDLFLNFSGNDFQTATQNGEVLGIRFAGTNDSGVNQVGLYSNITTGDVTDANWGQSSLKSYYQYHNAQNTMGTDIATKKQAYSYLYGDAVAQNPTKSSTKIQNVIASGNFLGGLDLLTAANLTDAGLNFAHFNVPSAYTFGFKLSKSLLAGILPDGISPFMAHVFLECGNDAVALASSVNVPTQEVPEPTALLSLGLVGLAFLGQRKKSVA